MPKLKEMSADEEKKVQKRKVLADTSAQKEKNVCRTSKYLHISGELNSRLKSDNI